MPKILVVDDDPEIVAFVTMGLEESGFKVVSAFDGEEAMTMARSEKPDLIILDLAMPRMHGFQVCRAIRADAALSETKIIVTSGKSYPVDIRTAKEAGADQYVVKPYGLKQLIEGVRRLLETL